MSQTRRRHQTVTQCRRRKLSLILVVGSITKALVMGAIEQSFKVIPVDRHGKMKIGSRQCSG